MPAAAALSVSKSQVAEEMFQGQGLLRSDGSQRVFKGVYQDKGRYTATCTTAPSSDLGDPYGSVISHGFVRTLKNLTGLMVRISHGFTNHVNLFMVSQTM